MVPETVTQMCIVVFDQSEILHQVCRVCRDLDAKDAGAQVGHAAARRSR